MTDQQKKTPKEEAEYVVRLLMSSEGCLDRPYVAQKLIEQAIQAERNEANGYRHEFKMLQAGAHREHLESIKLREENLRMREVIEFYAHGTKHPDKDKQGFENEFGCGCCVGLQTDSGIEPDFEMPGRAARRVLDQLQKESGQK